MNGVLPGSIIDEEPMSRVRSLFLLPLVSLVAIGAWRLTVDANQEIVIPPDREAAAQVFLDALSDEARAVALRDFDDHERMNWHFVPRRRAGLSLGAMTQAQRTATHGLLGSVLSERGYQKATGVVTLEETLGILENNPTYRDPGRYHVTVFGSPSTTTPWGWRFEGHHLSLNVSLVAGIGVAATPAFFGANPAEHQGIRLLSAEEDRARELMSLFDEEARDVAVIHTRAPRDIITGADRHARLEVFQGLPAFRMTPEQREGLLLVIREYTHNMQPDIAAAAWQRIEAAGVDSLYFAWAGNLQKRQGHYYRIHGPTLLIEYDNTQNDANHVHSVWRAFEGDFGEDLLHKHYKENPHH